MKKKIISVILTAVMAVSSVQVFGINNVKADVRDLGGFVSRLYNVCLDREASVDEINYWKNTVDAKGNTGISLAYEFVQSPEFLSKDLTNEEYVSYMYSALMGRDSSGDPDGLAYWAGLMNSGVSKEEIFVGFANSDEFFDICNEYGVVAGSAMVGKDPHELVGANYYTDRCYNVILGRSCDRAGMEYWSASLATNATAGATLAENFLFSGEYIAKNKSNDDFLTDLYEAMMGRAPIRDELNYWISVIEAGAPDRTIFRDFVGAPEFTSICERYGIVPGTVSEDGPSSAREEEPETTLYVVSWNEEFPGIVETYSDVSVDSVIIESQYYQAYLDMTMASGSDVPDVFVCDVDYARKYICSDNTLSIAELGITGSDVSQMYDYTFQFGTDNSGNLKALSWQCCPSVVFYNRTVAQQTLGTSDPAQVANYFSSWDAVRNTADIVNRVSNGQCKIVAGWQDMYRSVACNSSWYVNGELGLGQSQIEFLDLAKYLTDNDLTWGCGQWYTAWDYHAMDNSTLSYWGPMWLGRFSLEFEASETATNPTAGNWGIVPAPRGFMWGGTFVMASKYCKDKTLAGQLIKDVCCNTENLTDMALNGEFVNNNAVMLSMVNNSECKINNYAGQDVVAYLIQAAQSIDVSGYSSVGNEAYFELIDYYISEIVDLSEVNELFAFYYDIYQNRSESPSSVIRFTYYGDSDNDRLYDGYSSMTVNGHSWSPSPTFTTSNSFFDWELTYCYREDDDGKYFSENYQTNDVFYLEFYYGDELLVSTQTEGLLDCFSYEEDGVVKTDYEIRTSARIEPFGGDNFQAGEYSFKVYDSNHVLIENYMIMVYEDS